MIIKSCDIEAQSTVFMCACTMHFALSAAFILFKLIELIM